MRVQESRRCWLRRRRVRPLERKHPIPKHTETREVSSYRVVIEVALHDRLEPSPGVRQAHRPFLKSHGGARFERPIRSTPPQIRRGYALYALPSTKLRLRGSQDR